MKEEIKQILIGLFTGTKDENKQIKPVEIRIKGKLVQIPTSKKSLWKRKGDATNAVVCSLKDLLKVRSDTIYVDGKYTETNFRVEIWINYKHLYTISTNSDKESFELVKSIIEEFKKELDYCYV